MTAVVARKTDTALYSKEKSLLDLESEWQSKHDALRLESSDQIAQLKDQLAQVTRRLAASTSEDRANWEREKELELLSVKKAVWEEKERQLVELRAQMNDEAARARREADSELRTRDAEITRLRGLLRKDTADVGVQCDVDVGAIGLLADVLGEPPELPLPRLVQIAADSLASRENIIRRQAVELEEKDRTIVEMRREQPSIVAGKVREVRVALEKEMAERLDEERGARETEARDLRRHYETELERLRDSHEARTEELRARLRAAEEERDRTPELSLEELERLFPGHVATLRSEWDAEVANRIREVEERADAERAAHEREMGQMRAQYSDAYSAAIGKLKDEYARLEGKMAERYRVELERRQVAWDKERDEIRRNHEMEIRDVAERARRDPNGELRREARRLEDKVAETERTVATLKDALAEAALEHSQAMQELKKRMGEEHQMILLKVKDKYLTTLRGMRDDVAASKERSAERMEIEWRKRKEKLEGEWSARLVAPDRVAAGCGRSSRCWFPQTGTAPRNL